MKKIYGWYVRTPLVVLNIAAFVLGCIGGLLVWKLGTVGYSATADWITSVLQPFGNILIFMLKMIVVPIILCSLVCGAASLPFHQFGKMGVAVIIWYLATSLYAAVFGCFTALVCNPKVENISALTGSMMAQAHSMQTEAMGDSPLLKLIYGMFMNPFQALAEGRFLPVIVFSILLGLAARAMLDTDSDPNTRDGVALALRVFGGIQHIIFRIVDWVMRYFPIGIFALTLTCFASYGMALLNSYFQIALSVIIGILLMILGCYPLFIFLLCRENPYPILWKLREPILTAFVTRSSAAALPVSLRTAQEKMHVRKEIAGFTLSLGATVNMDGVCLHLPVFAVLAANLFGFSLGPSQIFLLVISVVFASIGAGGVPGGSIFLLFMALDCLHLSPEQSATIVALALGINPLLDMFETACNVAGDNVGTYIISKRLKMIEAPSEKSEL
jgi:Na+/H+-dicarboxylate symporter